MDPKACLLRARDARDDGDLPEMMDALKDYRAWRARGGFEPTMDDGTRGDDFCRSVLPLIGR